MPRHELDIDLNPSRPGDRRPEASRLVPGRGECAGESLYLSRCGFTARTVYNGAARVNGIFPWPIFEHGVLRMQRAWPLDAQRAASG